MHSIGHASEFCLKAHFMTDNNLVPGTYGTYGTIWYVTMLSWYQVVMGRYQDFNFDTITIYLSNIAISYDIDISISFSIYQLTGCLVGVLRHVNTR